MEEMGDPSAPLPQGQPVPLIHLFRVCFPTLQCLRCESFESEWDNELDQMMGNEILSQDTGRSLDIPSFVE